MRQPDAQAARAGLTRRSLLGAAGAGVAVGAAIDRTFYVAGTGETPPTIPTNDRGHQAGITTPTQNFLQFGTYDLRAEGSDDLKALLKTWTQAIELLTTGNPIPGRTTGTNVPKDTGEAEGLSASKLTITIGLGATLFRSNGHDRLGLAHRMPAELAPLPPFKGEALEPASSNGDLCIQACADDAQVAFHALHTLTRLADPIAGLRWTQAGFGRTATTSNEQKSPRNLIGFHDGTNNIHREDTAALDRHVWVPASDQPDWMRDGTYLAVRKIRILLDVWDNTSLPEQERTIGRCKQSGAPLGAHTAHDPVDLNATLEGTLAIPADAHIRLASPNDNNGARLLRRGYSYNDGYDAASGQINAGLLFLSYQRSLLRQFVPIQTKLANSDALSHHLQHTASATFAIPKAADPGGYIGDALLDR